MKLLVTLGEPEMVFMEIAFQNSCRLCSIRECKPDMLTAFLLQFSKAFFFQQCAVVDNSKIVGQQGNLRKNVTGNQNRFSSCVAKLPNKGAYFCNTDGIEAPCQSEARYGCLPIAGEDECPLSRRTDQKQVSGEHGTDTFLSGEIGRAHV